MKVIIHVHPAFNELGVRQLLGQIGVIAPMLQEGHTITTVMTDDQIERFRGGRGAAHRVEIVPDPPPPVAIPETPASEETLPEFLERLAEPKKHIAHSVRLAYADYLISCAETVSIMSPEEAESIRDRALAGEFDDQIHPPQNVG